jgi:predicted amino acid dehydrogenase
VPQFAALGHQENWDQIASIVAAMRPRDAAAVGIPELRTIVPWIPPRTVSRFRLGDGAGGPAIPAVYIDTFITPDELAAPANRRTVEKVRAGIAAAVREGVPVVALGGFTSILLEAGAIEPVAGIAVTTGNSLTAALIVRGVERALRKLGRQLADETVLIIGATGDAGKARCLLLTARNLARLEQQARKLAGNGPVEVSALDVFLVARATVVIAAASTAEPTFDLTSCSPDAIVCDAGYPKNFRTASQAGQAPRVFWGGMGRLAAGLWSDDGVLERFYRFPVPSVAHGCMLEGVALALAGRHESYSGKRGSITPDRMREIWSLAEHHGVTPAPLFNDQGLWPEERADLPFSGAEPAVGFGR